MNLTAAASAAQSARAPSSVEAAVRSASARTGVDFSYLMEKAAVESGFRTDVKAGTSSATGLYQFIDSTWLTTLKENGAKHGLGRFANAIETRRDGRPFVADPQMRQQILDLRKDPQASALMAAEFTRANKEHLETNVGGAIGSTELYMAHFLGAHGAAKFLNTMKQDPLRAASEVFPEAAAANRAVFFNKDGKPKSLQAIYDNFDRKFRDGDPTQPAGAAVAERVRRGDMPEGFVVQSPTWPVKALGASALSIYQVLALNALETPDEARTDKPQTKDEAKRVRDQPVRTAQDGDVRLGLGLALGSA